MELSTSRWVLALTGAAAGALLASCGQVPAPAGPGSPGTEDTATSAPQEAVEVIDPDAELVGSAMLLQSGPDAPVEACFGGVLTSYPPQCGGPELKGQFSWDEVVSETASGVTWSEPSYWIVGRYDPTDGEQGSFTLTRPVSAGPPDGVSPPTAEDARFPQLCDDPSADVPDVDQAARTRGPEGMGEEQALLEMLYEGGLDGYVTSWVSDGGPTLNVVVTHDAAAARAAMRAVFRGPLCVEERDLPTQADLLAAQEALGSHHRELGLLSSGAGGVSGLLEVEVLVADHDTVDAIHEAVAEWLTPQQVVIASNLRPLGQTP